MNFHGGDIYRLQNQQVLDFSSNINPLGVPESFKQALVANLEAFTRYPDLEYLELRRALAVYVGLQDLDWIIPGNGAVELIYHVIRAGEWSSVVTLNPTFSEYGRATRQQKNLQLVEIDAFDPDYGTVDLEVLLAAVQPRSLVIICNPNNPTGSLLSIGELEYLAKHLAQRDSTLLLDESFIEFTDAYPNTSMTAQLPSYPNLIVIRALTKFFGMPGIRLGYALTANQELATQVRETLEPWNVNTSAVIAGCTILQDQEYIRRSREWLVRERDYLYTSLQLVGLKVYPSQANFFLAQLQKIAAWQLKSELLAYGILIRTPEGFNNLSPGHFRLAVKEHTANEQLVLALGRIL